MLGSFETFPMHRSPTTSPIKNKPLPPLTMPAEETTQLFAQDDDMKTRFAAKSKAELDLGSGSAPKPTANHGRTGRFIWARLRLAYP